MGITLVTTENKKHRSESETEYNVVCFEKPGKNTFNLIFLIIYK